MLVSFFEKFPPELGEKTAVEMIDFQIDCALAKLKKKDEEKANEYLAKAYLMLDAYFTEKMINPLNAVK